MSTLNVEGLSAIIRGNNKETIQKLQKFKEVCANDPVLRNDPSDYGKSRPELLELQARKTHRFHKVLGYDEESSEFCFSAFPEQMATTLNLKMFIPTIRNLGTEKQIEKWIPQAQSFQIIGCYAQTELGHGSDVQSLETIATYDVDKEEFIIHSPTKTSTKWWIGDLGIYATHCVTHAQTIINGKNQGVQTFIVPLRDPNTYKLLPGVIAGDIGPKFGFNTKDNGFVRFHHIRIPRENMLMKYAKVTKSGEFQKAMNEKVGYATMMQVRCAILRASFTYLSMALTIAVRYSQTRKQFKDENGIERHLIDYQTQQDKLLPLIADSYAIVFAEQKIRWLTQENVRRINEKMDFSLMQDLHALLACSKAVYTWQAYFGIEKVRQSCGGHGYSAYSRLPSLLMDFSPNCTYEGENTVMLLQCARYLLKAMQKAQKGSVINENVEYLHNMDETLKSKLNLQRFTQLLCPETLRRVLRFNATFHVQKAQQKLVYALSEKEASPTQAWNQHGGISLVEAAIAHNYYWTMKNFMDYIIRVHDEHLKNALARLCCLYGISRVLEKPHSYIEGGFMQGSELEFFYEAKEYLLEQLKPDARSLVDAYGYNENQLFSALIYDNPYEVLLDWAKNKNNTINDPKFQKEVAQRVAEVAKQKIAAKL